MSHVGVTLEKITALCKRRGFFYPSCDIYGGLNGVYDKGDLGVLLERKITKLWERHMRSFGSDMVLMDGSLLGNESVWQASGHIQGFHDPLIDCKACKVRYRADDIDIAKVCTRCGKRDWSEIRQFHMMFKTSIGAASDSASIAYLRPETAQNIYVQFKNIFSSSRVKIPFGVMQTGKAFRNEITPRQFLFRVREFSQMEMEFFCKPEQAPALYEQWVEHRLSFYRMFGWNQDHIRVHHQTPEERAHYSKATADIEFSFPFGWRELEGIAYRTDFDLSQHMKQSNKDLSVFDEATKTSFIPHVVECSVGVERLMLALLCASYHEEAVQDGETRTVLRLPVFAAPIQVAILPLTKAEEDLAQTIYQTMMRYGFDCIYDQSGSIGKRYRRYDEIGVPYCITIDGYARDNQEVTIRMRDSMMQERVSSDALHRRLLELLQAPC